MSRIPDFSNIPLNPSSRRKPGPRLSTGTHAENLGPDFRRDDESKGRSPR